MASGSTNAASRDARPVHARRVAPVGSLRRTRRTVALALAVAALAGGVRSLRAEEVLAPEGVVAFDGDSYYHLRRIAYTARNFPAVLRFDPYVNFPRGGEPIWSPPFDFLLAALVRIAPGMNERVAMEHALAFVPVALGMLHVLALFLVGRRLFPEPVAAAGALLLAILPAHYVYSQVGCIDHHVAVALMGTLVLFAAMGFVRRPAGRAAAGLGLAFACALALWPGSLVHVVVAEAALLAFLLSQPEREAAVGVAGWLAGAHALGAAVLAPLGLGRSWIEYGFLSPMVLSSFQPLWLAAGAACFAVLALAWRRFGVPRTVFGRTLAAIAAGAAVAGICLAALPRLSRGGLEVWSWLERTGGVAPVVSESQPLLTGENGVELGIGAEWFSGGFYFVPVALAALALAERRGTRRSELALFAFWCVAFLGLGLAQARFAIEFAPALALLLPAGFHAALHRLAPARWRARGAAAASIAALALCLPVLGWYRENATGAGSGEPARGMEDVLELGRWLRAHSPGTSGYLEPGPPPEYGVLAPWDIGHALRWAAARPVVQDNFGNRVGSQGLAAADAYFSAESDAAALDVLEWLRVRYVVVGPGGSGRDGGPRRASLRERLRRQSGGPPLRREDASVPASWLERHRLVYETRTAAEDDVRRRFQLFEVVPGARIEGAAEPRAAVEASLVLRTNAGRHLR